MTLSDLRRQIDSIDTAILHTLATRMQTSRQIKAFKKSGAIDDPAREDELRHLWRKQAKQLGLSPEFAANVLSLILTESKRIQSS